jgi:hypothetical protein
MKEVRRNRDGGDRVQRRPEKKRFDFKFNAPSQEEMERRANRRTSTYDSLYKDDYKEWRAKGGSNTVRILPPTWTLPNGKTPHYGYEFWAHSFVGADNGSYPCLRKMKEQRCPICEAHRMAVKEGDEDETRKLSPRQVFVYWIVDREADSAYKNKPQLWTVSNIRDKEIMGITQDRKSRSFIYIQHPDEGYDLSFNREGQGLNTKYISYQFDRDPSPISQSQDIQDDILEYITEHPLPDCLQYYDADYLDNVMFGTATNESDPDLSEDEEQAEETDETDEHEGSESDEEGGEEEGEEERADEEEEDAADEAGEEDEPDEDEPEVAPPRRRVPERQPARASAAVGNGRGTGKPGRDRVERPRGTTIARKPQGKDRTTRSYNK